MPTEWERSNEVIESVCRALNGDPTNLDLASRYWMALGDKRDGRSVIAAYRAAALASSVGVAAFARAYRELFDVSGESPRLVYFDTALIQALQRNRSELPRTDRENVQWILRSIGVAPPSP
jgi:hypothetical protein